MDPPQTAEETSCANIFRNICVYCGSSKGNNPIFVESAESLADELVLRGIGLVYGGGSVGLMGALALKVDRGGGHVLGLLPKEMENEEFSGKYVGETRIVANMHERKQMMFDAADAFIALPGGFGTLEELLEMITWSQLGYHTKPIGVLNMNGFYDNLLGFFDKLTEEGFVHPAARSIVLCAPTAAELVDLLEAHAT
mmetsp:Transcript_21442/g.29800  ORF Transcript_21442/g.29800 Transcript_21442/m.29800 type:complete len:197 (+) Transcript_21442:129-719(+)|eukprot:CAMPEP_0196588992 /NCGR_PEP_ID=MMETSP1081-20130531/62320_1 /TAXON_ID=36882 /ORGANISM="Pyramimonas amylifera, Strain CCMP720" /LENGTH=196 /DNA_ID=CAMNT_0041911655 /DNA_START=129 /DNA_END=719 /DNA_ORIENTATION=+